MVVGVDAGDRGDGLGGERLDRGAQLVEAGDDRRQPAEVDQVVGEEHLDHRHSRWASVPGRIGTHSSAWSAVSVRRGSTTTTFPPRAWMASSRPGKSGAVQRLPFDA